MTKNIVQTMDNPLPQMNIEPMPSVSQEYTSVGIALISRHHSLCKLQNIKSISPKLWQTWTSHLSSTLCMACKYTQTSATLMPSYQEASHKAFKHKRGHRIMTLPNTNGKTINQSKIESPRDSSVTKRLVLFWFVFFYVEAS